MGGHVYPYEEHSKIGKLLFPLIAQVRQVDLFLLK